MEMELSPNIISGTGIPREVDISSMGADLEIGSLVQDIWKLCCVWDVVLVEGLEG